MLTIREQLQRLCAELAHTVMHKDCPEELRSLISSFICDVQGHGNGLTQLAVQAQEPLLSAMMDMVDPPLLVDPNTPTWVELDA